MFLTTRNAVLDMSFLEEYSTLRRYVAMLIIVVLTLN
jgi:hypothetical protein